MALEHDSDSALARAVVAAGSQSEFGRIIGKRQSVVSDWLKRGVLLPAKYVEVVELATGVSKYELRPDLAELYSRSDVPEQPAPLAKPSDPDCEHVS